MRWFVNSLFMGVLPYRMMSNNMHQLYFMFTSKIISYNFVKTVMTEPTRCSLIPDMHNCWHGWALVIPWKTLQHIAQFLAATKQLYEWFSPSVCPSVRLSVCLSHLFDYVPIIVSSWNFRELLPVTEVTSMQKVKVKGQGHRGHKPTLPFPDCNSSLNSRMIMKWCI